MLTRTAGPALARRGVHLVAVDPGFVSDQNTVPAADRRTALGGRPPPLDAVDGAARVLAPVFDAAGGEAPQSAVLLRDYRTAPW